MKHVVVAIISRKNKNNKNEFLLVSSKRNFGEYSGFYYPPGGHIEKGENEKAALEREIKEELNLDIEPIEKITETLSDIKDQTTHWWKCKIKSGEIKIKKSEINKAGYFTEENMKTINIWPATKKFFQKFIFTN